MAAPTVSGALILVGLCSLISCSRAQPEWRTGAWQSPCTETCGGGEQQRTTSCSTKDGQSLSPARCAHLGPRPQTIRKCNTQDCPPTIYKNAYTPCEDCFRNRTLVCLVRQDDGFSIAVPISRCNLTSNFESAVCTYGLGCLVKWISHSYPCCHAKAAQGYVCTTDMTNASKILPDWICHKLHSVGNLKIPQAAPCNPTATCEPPTEPPTTTYPIPTATSTLLTTTQPQTTDVDDADAATSPSTPHPAEPGRGITTYTNPTKTVVRTSVTPSDDEHTLVQAGKAQNATKTNGSPAPCVAAGLALTVTAMIIAFIARDI